MNYTKPLSAGVSTSLPIYQQIPLFMKDETALYHPSSEEGYFALLVKEGGTRRQSCYPVRKLDWVLSQVDPNKDSYISQANFYWKSRRVVALKNVGLAFVDVDCYKKPWAVGRTPEQLASSFVYFCVDEGIPAPSLIIFSGRGLQVKWLFDKAIPRMALPRWNAMERALVKKFGDLGADPQARDASRVLRIVETCNTKSKKYCHVIHVTPGPDGAPIRYDFDNFLEYVLPLTRSEVDKSRKTVVRKNVAPDNGFNLETLNWTRLEDLRTLLALRGGISEGMRMSFLMYSMNFLALSHQVSPENFYKEASFLAHQIDPSWNYRSQELSTVYSRMKKYFAGETIEYNGIEFSPLYTPRTQTLIDLFEIDTDEQSHMKSIIGEDIRRERDRASHERVRREQGVVSREEYLAHAQGRQERAIDLRKQGLSIRAIAVEMQISKSQVQRYLQVSHVCPVN